MQLFGVSNTTRNSANYYISMESLGTITEQTKEDAI